MQEVTHVKSSLGGAIKIAEISTTGEEMIKELLGVGDIFGDILLGSDCPLGEYEEVISGRVSYLAINQDHLIALMEANQVLTMNYLAKVNEKYKTTQDRFVNIPKKDVESRIIYCIKEWALKHGRKVGDRIVVKNLLTHHEFANMISTSRQTVTKIFK